MLHLTWFEFFVRTIPESFFVILAVHAFSKQKVSRNRFVIASLLYAVSVFLIRWLPISFGTHTIINVIILIMLVYYINRISMVVSIKSSIISAILLYMCELINVFFIQYILRLDVEKMYTSVYIKTLYSLPSLILLIAVSSLSYYFFARKNKEAK